MQSLGKVVLEKILRSLPVVKTIYLAITPKVSGHVTNSMSWQINEPNSEFSRFQQEIMESQIFDRLKQQLGFKDFNKLMKEKVKTLPMNLVCLLLANYFSDAARSRT